MAKANEAKATAEDNSLKKNQHAIKMAALGRRFLLGTLYDYSNDSIVPGGGIIGLNSSIDAVDESPAKPQSQSLSNLMSSSMFSTFSADDSLDFLDVDRNSNFVQVKGTVLNNFNVRVDCLSFEQGPSSKWQHMKLDHHLRASVLAKLVDKMRGAAIYCTDETDTAQAVKVVRVRVNVKKEGMSPDQTLMDQETHSATHFVSEIAHGVEAYAVFSCQVKEDESKADLEEEMEITLNQLVHALTDEMEPNFSQDFQLRMKGRFYGDLHQHPRDCSLAEAHKLLSKLVRDVKQNTEKAIPIAVWLQPICKETCPKFVDLDPDLVDDCIDMLDGITKIKSRVFTFLKEDEKMKFFPHMRHSLRQFIDHSSRYAELFRSELNRLLPAVRSGNKDIQPIAKLLDVMAEGLFHPNKLGKWLSNKHKEVKALRVIAGMAALKKVSLIQTKDKLDECLFDLSNKWAVILVLPPLDGRSDPLLQEMKHYIEHNKRIVRIQHDSSLLTDQEELPWFTVPNVCHELTKTARRMIQQIDWMASAHNENGESVAFYMTSLLPSPSPYFPTLSLYKEAQLVNDNFNLPVPPTNLRLKLDLKRIYGVVLEWDCQQIKDVTHFLLQFKKIGSPREWQSTSTLNSNSTCFELKNVKEPYGLQFRVACVSLIGRSEFSAVFEVHTPSAKNCPPPANLRTGIVTHNSIELLWDSPHLQHPNYSKPIGYEIHCAEHQPNLLLVSTTIASCRLEALMKDTEYKIDVLADYGPDGRSSVQTIRVTTLSPTNRLCDLLRRQSPMLGTYSGLEIYRLPLTSVPTPDVTKIRRFVFGQPSSAAVRGSAQHKTVLVMGATGSGKTTLINGMINFILGVEWDDNFRFKIIIENSSMSQAFSQTSAVTAYEIHYTDGFKIPYSLTIVDTPGYGDTKGLSHDQFITTNIRQFFEDQCGIQEVDAVGFVSQASLPRLTPTQIYIFDSVLSIFGKDIQENVQFLLTFADSQEPPVLAAIQEAKIPCPLDDNGHPQHHKFNNSGFFAANQGPDAIATRFNHMFWKMGMENFKNFFGRLSSLTTKSLSLTRQVLDERKRLEVTVEGLQPKIHQGLTKMEELRKTRMFVANNEAQIDANVDVEFEVEVNVAKKIDISGMGHFLTNCQVCHVTCHYPCGIARDEDKKGCWAMDGSAGYCRICPNKCFWSSHANQTYRYEYVLEKQKSSSDQLRRKYERLLEKKMSAQDLIDALEQDLKIIQGDVLQLVKTAAGCIHRLEEIALRPNPCSTPEYIDMMVNAEQQEKREGFKERVKSLLHVRQLAELTQKIRNKETLMQGAEVPQSAFGNDSEPQNIEEEDQVKLEKFQNLFL